MKHIPAQWDTCKLKDVALIGDGAHASIQRIDKGILYLTSKNFGKDRLVLSKVDYIAEDDYNKYFNTKSKALTKPEADDILLGIIGTLGAPYLVKEDDFFGLSSSVSIIRPDFEKLSSSYLYFWFKTPLFQNAINQIKSGVAQSFLSLAMIGSLPCVYPKSIEAQQKIATILSAYDDLIENNLKRIKLLEEMAQITYEEWFVRLKFPGHETTPMGSETGLPDGWNEAEITAISFINANSIKTKDAPESIKYIDIAPTGTGFYQEPDAMSFVEAPSRARRKVNFGDTIFSTVRPNRKTYSLILEDDPMLVASTGFAVLTPKIKNTFPFVYLTVANQTFVDKTVSVAGGAAYPAINQNDFEKIKIKKPDDALIKLFSEKVINNFIAKRTLTKQNQLLKEARDILLPRLMTGMIDVERLVLPEPFSNTLSSPAQELQTS